MLLLPFLHSTIIDAGVLAERPQRHRRNETQHLIESVPCPLIQFCSPGRYYHFFVSIFSYVWILESKSRRPLKTRHEVTAETFTVYENKSTEPLTARQ